jgi:anti-anti-sigma regulatory factor
MQNGHSPLQAVLCILYSSSHHIVGQEFEPLIQLDWSPHTSSACSATPALAVTLSRLQPTTTVCTVTGAVTWNTRPLLSKALTQARHDDNTYLVIDLSGVTSMDSAGPYTLLEARAKHRLTGGAQIAVITSPNSSAIPELQAVAIHAAFTVYLTLADALHACTHSDTPIRHPTPQTIAPPSFACPPGKNPLWYLHGAGPALSPP